MQVELSPVLIGSLVLVGALWGCTNPLLKHGNEGVAAVRRVLFELLLLNLTLVPTDRPSDNRQ